MPSTPGAAPRCPIYVDEVMVGRLLAAMDVEARSPLAAVSTLVDSLSRDHLMKEVATPSDLGSIEVGDIVTLRGRSAGNPLLRILDFVAVVGPIASDQTQPARSGRAGRGASAARGGAGSVSRADGTTAEEEILQRTVINIVSVTRAEMHQNPLVDVQVTTDGGLRVVLTLERSALGPAGEAHLGDGIYDVVGKVTAVLGETESINLFRRCALAATGPQMSRDMLQEFADVGLDIEEAEPIFSGPALQVMPIAVLI